MEKTLEAPAREAIPDDAKWDLTPLYPSHEDWEVAFKGIDPLVERLLSFKGRLGDPEALAAVFKADDELDLLLERLYVYAHLKSDEDTGDSANRGRLDRVSAKAALIEGETSWMEPELMELPKRKFSNLRKSPALKFYKRTLELLERDRTHTLSEPEERILGLASDVFGTPYKTFTLLSNADIKMPEVPDGSGGKVQLTHGNYIKLLESDDREVRRAAFSAMYDTYGKFKNTYSAILDGTVKANALDAKLRGYNSALDAALHPDNVPRSIYDGLIASVRNGLPSLHAYFKMRTEALGLDKLDMFDIHTPLVKECKLEVKWDDAVKMVADSFKPLGEEYCKILQRAFSERWIDRLECKGKRSGAYSSGCYRKPPYILMNYSGTLDSVFTLAHELGHSMHSYFSDNAQDFHYASYRIFVAEVASTTNELLLHSHLMAQAPSDEVKAYLLNHLADEIRGTLFRQTMFAEFERDIYSMSETSEPLTSDSLCEKYSKLNADYHGDAVCPDKRIECEWARIPHFHYNFYVYKYATGISAAVSLSKRILAGDTGRYLDFLKAGGSKDVLDIMKDAGVDLSEPFPVESAIKLFGETVSELGSALKRMRG